VGQETANLYFATIASKIFVSRARVLIEKLDLAVGRPIKRLVRVLHRRLHLASSGRLEALRYFGCHPVTVALHVGRNPYSSKVLEPIENVINACVVPTVSPELRAKSLWILYAGLNRRRDRVVAHEIATRARDQFHQLGVPVHLPAVAVDRGVDGRVIERHAAI
jgi:hypothetical protein